MKFKNLSVLGSFVFGLVKLFDMPALHVIPTLSIQSFSWHLNQKGINTVDHLISTTILTNFKNYFVNIFPGLNHTFEFVD